MVWLALPLLVVSLAGIGYTIHSGLAVGRFARSPWPAEAKPEPVTLLKPLHGAEPRLAENLRGFTEQDWGAPIELIAGVQRADDPAAAVAHAFAGDVRLVIDPTRHGANAKVGNLINMMVHAHHELLIVSDSDIAVPSDYVRVVAAALAEPGVGAVSLLYRGRGDAGFWSVLAAGAISYAFVPGVLLGRALGRVQPCLGSTIALRRATLERIGGFAAFCDILADDGAIGAAVQALGLRVAMPRLIVTHGCAETSFAGLWRHELRWAATIRHFDASAYVGLVLTHPLPFAILALPFAPAPATVVLLAALGARLWQVARIDRLLGPRSMPRAWLPLRDILSFATFLASFLARSVDWRGETLVLQGERRIVARPETTRR